MKTDSGEKFLPYLFRAFKGLMLLNSPSYSNCILQSLLILLHWRRHNLPMWQMFCHNLSCFNEESQEIAFGLLAQSTSSDTLSSVFSHLDQKWKLLRSFYFHSTELAVDLNSTTSAHYSHDFHVRPDDESVSVLVEHFKKVILSIKNRSFKVYRSVESLGSSPYSTYNVEAEHMMFETSHSRYWKEECVTLIRKRQLSVLNGWSQPLRPQMSGILIPSVYEDLRRLGQPAISRYLPPEPSPFRSISQQRQANERPITNRSQTMRQHHQSMSSSTANPLHPHPMQNAMASHSDSDLHHSPRPQLQQDASSSSEPSSSPPPQPSVMRRRLDPSLSASQPSHPVSFHLSGARPSSSSSSAISMPQPVPSRSFVHAQRPASSSISSHPSQLPSLPSSNCKSSEAYILQKTLDALPAPNVCQLLCTCLFLFVERVRQGDNQFSQFCDVFEMIVFHFNLSVSFAFFALTLSNAFDKLSHF